MASDNLIAALNKVGPLLYGSNWQSALARDLNVAVRTVQRWAAGEYSPPPGVRDDLIFLADQRASALLAAADRLRDQRENGHG